MLPYYLKRLSPGLILYLVLNISLRMGFSFLTLTEIPIVQIPFALLLGALFDTLSYSIVVLPFLFILLLLPQKYYHDHIDRLLTYSSFVIFTFLIYFNAVGEWFFWDEFSLRYNFIAVDYLVYKDEVIGNIKESYPVLPILSMLSLLSLLSLYYCRDKLLPKEKVQQSISKKFTTLGLLSLPGMLSLLFLPTIDMSNNNYINEISHNGLYSLIYAFKHNELDFNQLYLNSRDLAIKEKHINTKLIQTNKKTIKPNVIFVIMESMSADYLPRYGNTHHIASNLNALSYQSLNFTHLYATGTRTVRGLEALSLSIPPTPGRSIVKRPHNENLFSVGEVFNQHGYKSVFFYGGYGYFDNMNYFFAHNGYQTIDRSNIPKQAIRFANIWGVSDEDLYKELIKRADSDSQTQQPFFYTVMTTSNHRPFTYLPGKIDIPPKTGRNGGAKYADYAIGQFLKEARKKPWFDNTIFVFVADHTAGAAGKTSLPPNRYHIPAMIYAPKLIARQQVNTLCSQIDLPVTLMALLGFDYQSKFFGKNILSHHFKPRAFLSTYQKLGKYIANTIYYLQPIKEYGAETEDGHIIAPKNINKKTLASLVSDYQLAAKWKSEYKK